MGDKRLLTATAKCYIAVWATVVGKFTVVCAEWLWFARSVRVSKMKGKGQVHEMMQD